VGPPDDSFIRRPWVRALLTFLAVLVALALIFGAVRFPV
jgi:hypothetical protein